MDTRGQRTVSFVPTKSSYIFLINFNIFLIIVNYRNFFRRNVHYKLL